MVTAACAVATIEARSPDVSCGVGVPCVADKLSITGSCEPAAGNEDVAGILELKSAGGGRRSMPVSCGTGVSVGAEVVGAFGIGIGVEVAALAAKSPKAGGSGAVESEEGGIGILAPKSSELAEAPVDGAGTTGRASVEGAGGTIKSDAGAIAGTTTGVKVFVGVAIATDVID